MIDMGVPGYLVASSVVAILAQRLVRTICPKCRARYTPPERDIKEFGITEEQLKEAKFMKGRGCNSCQKTGYKGRIAVFEMMLLDSQIRELIFAQAVTSEIRKYAISKGMKTLYHDAIKKVLAGYTTFDEVARVTKKTEQD